jgi:hypothetical protein
MELMSAPETIIQANMPIRPLKRVEYERLAAEGFFEDERVELLFGMVIPMSPTDPYRRGETIAMAAFPDVAIAVSEILPPA